MKIKTSELKGAALDWAVAQAVGEKVHMQFGWTVLSEQVDDSIEKWSPSRRWSQGGPLFNKHAIEMRSEEDDNFDGWWIVEAYVGYADDIHVGIGRDKESKLVAFCRALVAAKFGDEVEIPDELCDERK